MKMLKRLLILVASACAYQHAFFEFKFTKLSNLYLRYKLLILPNLFGAKIVMLTENLKGINKLLAARR